jgi:hypothetical protein
MKLPRPMIYGLIGACIGLLGLNVWNWWEGYGFRW